MDQSPRPRVLIRPGFILTIIGLFLLTMLIGRCIVANVTRTHNVESPDGEYNLKLASQSNESLTVGLYRKGWKRPIRELTIEGPRGYEVEWGEDSKYADLTSAGKKCYRIYVPIIEEE